jgi:hypothetical protein
MKLPDSGLPQNDDRRRRWRGAVLAGLAIPVQRKSDRYYTPGSGSARASAQ